MNNPNNPNPNGVPFDQIIVGGIIRATHPILGVREGTVERKLPDDNYEHPWAQNIPQQIYVKPDNDAGGFLVYDKWVWSFPPNQQGGRKRSRSRIASRKTSRKSSRRNRKTSRRSRKH
jgi:hypothetical protein